MIEIKNNQCIALSELQFTPYEEFMQFIHSGKMRCINIAARKNNNAEIDVYALFVMSDSTLCLEYTKLDPAVTYPSIGSKVPSWVNFERELAEDFGIKYTDNPWLKPVRFPSDAAHGLSMAQYPFFKETGYGVHEVAVGPVHAGVIEPGHFRFMCRGEKIDHLEIQLGYQHRGVQKLMCQGKFNSKRVLAESIVSDSAVINSWLYFNIIEKAVNITVPPRAAAIRTIAAELEIAALHLSTLSGIANDIGYVMGAAFAGATRTYIINSLQSICGNRFGRGLMTLGGVAFDINDELNKKLTDTLTMVHDRVAFLKKTMLVSPAVLSRLERTGTVDEHTAAQIGLTGVAGRASNVKCNARNFTDNEFYKDCEFQAYQSAVNGDVFSRTDCRIAEALASLKIALDLLAGLPDGAVCAADKGEFRANSLIISIGEGPRGEISHMAITPSNENEPFALYKIKDPSFINWFALALSVRNNQISDFPLCNKSFDLSYSGNDL